jgi:hypothetical protein
MLGGGAWRGPPWLHRSGSRLQLQTGSRHDSAEPMVIHDIIVYIHVESKKRERTLLSKFITYQNLRHSLEMNSDRLLNL